MKYEKSLLLLTTVAECTRLLSEEISNLHHEPDYEADQRILSIYVGACITSLLNLADILGIDRIGAVNVANSEVEFVQSILQSAIDRPICVHPSMN